MLLDLLDLHLEDHGLSGQVRHIVLGKGDVQLLLVAGFQSHDLLLEAGDKGTRAQLQAVIFSLTAFEGHAVVKALKVDDGGVPVLGFPVHADQAGGAGDVGLELVLNVLVSDGRLSLGGGEALVLAQLHLGTDGDQGLESKALLADLHYLCLGVTHIVQALLLHSFLIGAGVDDIDGILIKHAGAVHPLNDLAGGLALPEAGHADMGAVLQISLLNGVFKLLSFHLDGQLHGALFFLFHVGDLHVSFSSCRRLVPSWEQPAFLLSPGYSNRCGSV